MRFFNCILLCGIICTLCSLGYACPADLNAAAIVLNDGEHVAYDKIETFGTPGIGYLKDSVVSGPSAPGPAGISLISQDFEYDPTASSNFSLKPMFSWNSGTLKISHYWALSSQPVFRCSLAVASDTLYLSYKAIPGPVNDWMPTVATTLTLSVNTDYKGLTVCFKSVPYARKPEENGFCDATKDLYAFLPLPPYYTYKYRAHSDSAIMVYLGYEQNSSTYKYSPRISIASDSTRSPSSAGLSVILSSELAWLVDKQICALSLSQLQSVSSTKCVHGGECYWTKQDSIISLNQWFLINGDLLRSQSLQVNGMRGGCGLGTEFDLPVSPLGATGVITSSPSSRRVDPAEGKAIFRKGVLEISSPIAFDNIRVFNCLGRSVYSGSTGSPCFKTRIGISGATHPLTSGAHILGLFHGNKVVSRMSVIF